MADSAPSEPPAKPSGKAPADAEQTPKSPPPRVDDTTFVNTKQHVADRQSGGGSSELFTSTKLSIALINDPKNGPRFTMTKRESGVTANGDDVKAPDPPHPAAAETDAQAPRVPASPPQAAPPAMTTSSVQSPTAIVPEKVSSSASAPSPSAATATPPVSDQPASQPSPLTATLSGMAPAGVPPAAEPPDKVPVDSSKTFVGRNGTYYDESWRWMDWRGTKRSWNWPAALSFGHWFAYRRLHLFAALHSLWLAGLAAATVNDIPILALAVLALFAIGLAGSYGNTLYFLAFRRAVDHVTEHGEGDYQELRGQLAKAGGISIVAPGVMALASISAIAAALGFTYYLRGGFQFNLWPFF